MAGSRAAQLVARALRARRGLGRKLAIGEAIAERPAATAATTPRGPRGPRGPRVPPAPRSK